MLESQTMNTPASWFDAVFIINLDRRTDRWAQAQREAEKILLPDSLYQRFSAYGYLVDETANINGNLGCTTSHRAVLEIIAHHHYERALVLEDDFMLRPKRAHEKRWDMERDFFGLFDAVTQELPCDWKMLYLGGQYAENPKRRYSPHLIETNGVLTTSSYVVGWKQARHMAPHIQGIGPIDNLYHRFNRERGCFMAFPRFFVQRPGLSDLTGRIDENATAMEDEHHEDMLLEGEWQAGYPAGGAYAVYKSKLNRRELSDPSQLTGTHQIVDGQLYICTAAQLPAHPRPWFRGERCDYTLRLP